MSHFFVHLPSNSSESYYPENTRSHFITRLLNKVELKGDWEVGLSEILFSKTWYNVKDGEYVVVKCIDCKSTRGTDPDKYQTYEYVINISGGNYASMQDLIRELNYQMADYADFVESPMSRGDVEHPNTFVDTVIDKYILWPKFKYNSFNNKVSVGIRRGLTLSLSDGLCQMLGFRKRELPIKGVDSSPYDIVDGARTADINAGLDSFYVYSDILECIPVGHTEAPLLRIVDSGEEKQGSLVRRHYQSPIYLPVQKKNFDSIEIDLRTDRGKPVPFQRGQVVVTLHFRKSDGNYFL